MPVQLQWQPNATPPAPDVVNLGLEIRGDDTSIGASTAGRVRLVEVQDPSRTRRGATEAAGERLIATFHGQWHRNATADASARVTFQINLGRGTSPPHEGQVIGFDPECMFGADALTLTFVNREFIIWFPFFIDSAAEGEFLEIVAIAETVPAGGGAAVVLGRSAVLNLKLRREHEVDSTSSFNNRSISYKCSLVGHRIVTPAQYLLQGSVRAKVQPNKDEIVTEPAFRAVAPAGAAPVTFRAYPANAMRILLLVDLLDGLLPDAAFVRRSVTGVRNADQTVQTAAGRMRVRLANDIDAIFIDAGFTGASALYSDGAAASALNTAFTGAFRRRSVGGTTWDLRDPARPLDTSFWNFFVGSSSAIQVAGTGEQVQSAATPRQIGGSEFFPRDDLPIAGGNKRVTAPIFIAPPVFRDLLEQRSGLPRTYANEAAYLDAVERLGGKLALLVSHEVAHTLGMMHHSKVITGSNYDEDAGSPVLSICSSAVDSGGFGANLRFHPQLKLIWRQAFGVTPQFSDVILQNKTWTAAEVTTVDWGERTKRFLERNGEGSIRRPFLGTASPTVPTAVPVFTGTGAKVQRGTFVPSP